MTVDLSDGYSFPTHIAAIDLRPDIVWWSDDQKTITPVELMVCFDSTNCYILNTSQQAILGSYKIWCSRNNTFT